MKRNIIEPALTVLVLTLLLFIPACTRGVSSQDYQNLSNQLNQAQATISSLQNENSTLKQEVLTFEQKIKSIETAYSALSTQASGLTKEIGNLSSLNSQLNLKLLSLENENRNLKAEIARLQATPAPVPSPAPVTKQKIITYSSTTVTQIGTTFPDRPKQGYVFLVVNMSIENQGYESFDISSAYFSVVVNNVKYSSAFVLRLENRVPSVEVLNGGKVTGQIAYEIPAGNTAFSLQYTGFGNYNIKWIKQ